MNTDELRKALEQCRAKADDLLLSLVAIRLSEALDILDSEAVTPETARLQLRPKPRKDV